MRGATHHAGRRCDCGAIISIHAPHARSDRTMHIGGSDRSQFQSTLLMRGATRLPSTARASAQNFNPRSSCEERLDIIRQRESQGTISIHAPHARSDPGFAGGRRQLYNFNPRSSCEERHFWHNSKTVDTRISIHAPHARSDIFMIMLPCGRAKFQSTLLMRGATRPTSLGR